MNVNCQKCNIEFSKINIYMIANGMFVMVFLDAMV